MARHEQLTAGATAPRALIEHLPGTPIVTSETAAGVLGHACETGHAAVAASEEDGVLAQVTLGRRNRAWECVGLVALVDDLERQLSGGAMRVADSADPRASVSLMLRIGITAPDFTLPDQNENEVGLSHFRGRPVILYFYPKADTPWANRSRSSSYGGLVNSRP